MLGELEQQLMLAIVRLRDNAYGISIQDTIEERTDHYYSIGSIYAALNRMEKKGFVKSRQGEPTPERGGRRKMYFQLTGTGAKALNQSLRALSALSQGLRLKELFA
jgi:PadR family transcriptional regulator, regulatory protein PadR